ncbi:MAG: transposase [Thermoplasmata archaeon]
MTYYKYPEPVIKMIISMNMIEHFYKKIRRIIKIIDFLPGKELPRKIIYLRVIE